MVQNVKNKLRQLRRDDPDCRLSRLLFALRTTPCADSARSPAQLLMNRSLRTLLSDVRPRRQLTEEATQSPGRRFETGDKVFVRSYRGNQKWLPATVVGVEGNCTFKLQREDGELQRAHANQMRKRQAICRSHDDESSDWWPLPIPTPSTDDTTSRETTEKTSTVDPVSLGPRRSERTRKKPDFYGVVVSN